MRGALPREERIYRELDDHIRPWAPAFLGSFKRNDWHVLLLEDVGAQTMPPWSPAKARRSAHSFAKFHASTYGRPLPRWLSRTEHQDFAGAGEDLPRAGSSRGPPASHGADPTRLASGSTLRNRSCVELRAPRTTPRPHSLLHMDTRSDNTRLQGQRLRMFDWNFASVGPHEIDVAAFAQATEAEGGPSVERTMAWYAESCPCATRISTQRCGDRRVFRGPLMAAADPRRAASSCLAAPSAGGLARVGGAAARAARAALARRRGRLVPEWPDLHVLRGCPRPRSWESASPRCACTIRWSCADASAAGGAERARAQRRRAPRALPHVRVRRQHASRDQPHAVRALRHRPDGNEDPRDDGVRAHVRRHRIGRAAERCTRSSLPRRHADGQGVSRRSGRQRR